MQLSLPFIDIIIFAIIAIFLVYRLKSILGQNSEGNEQNNKIDIGEKSFTNVVKLGKKQLNNQKAKNNTDAILTIDPSFNEKEFLNGARIFFNMVIDSFVKGNLDEVTEYIDKKLVKNFQSVINERLQEKETLKIEIINIKNTEIEDIKILKNIIKASVIFETEQIKVLKDRKGRVIDGDQKNSILVKDIWTFEKRITSEDKNWMLVETRDA